MNYRPELDGLRAIAVIPVMLFHAGMWPGGFVGVDVFFVISGYLITGILVSQDAEGGIRLSQFYERRARRILPALFVVSLACLPLAWWLLLPGEFVEWSRSLVSVATFSSNIHFWQQTGYFSTAAELKPLLHTWSLAIEEQFYLFYPVCLMLVWRFGRRYLSLLLWVGMVLSLGLSIALVGSRPSAAFFLLPTRAWELLVGALIAHRELTGHSHGENRRPCAGNRAGAIGFAGLALIVFAMMWFDERTQFPGVSATIPVLGTALVIVGAAPTNHAGRFLSVRPLVGMGLISYGAYLWHQPLLAFARIWSIVEPATWLLLSLLALSTLLAYLSWKLIEVPVRHGAWSSRRLVYAGAGIGSVTLIAIGAVGSLMDGFPARFELPASVVASFDSSSPADVCFGKPFWEPDAKWTCALGDVNLKPSVLVVGDSHARALFPAFDVALRQVGVGGTFAAASACPPLLDVTVFQNRFPWEGDCRDRNRAVWEHARGAQIRLVFLVARWPLYSDPGYDGDLLTPVGRQPYSPRSLLESRATIAQSLVSTAESYRQSGAQVVIVGDVPQQPVDVRRAYYRAFRVTGRTVDIALRQSSIPTSQHLQLQSFMTNAVESARTAQGLSLLSLDPVLCDADVCAMGTSEGAYYFDDNHLTRVGAIRIVPAIVRMLQEHLVVAR
ncbi:MAG: acyltransferase [Gemmatimonadales bacterium]|nr:acyltransferase [Gemmatimonadales bacterium]